MKSMSRKLKTLLLAPLTAMFLLFGFSLQGVHAQSLAMQDGMGTTSANLSCNSPCGNAAVVLKDEQKTPVRDEDQDPEPPEQLFQYAQNVPFPEPKKPVASLIFGSLIRPPDLVKLYANFRF